MSNDHRYGAVVNTHSSYHDILSVFLETYNRYMTGTELCVFSIEDLPGLGGDQIKLLKYTSKNFRDQYLECLLQVPYDYILTFNDDYFLMGSPQHSEISSCIDVLASTEYSHIRFVRGPNLATPAKLNNLYQIDNKKPYFFSQTLSLWKRADLIRVFDVVGPSGIGRKGNELQFELLANAACRQLELLGLVYFKNERKVGSAHYECNIVPHIVSAIVDGYWNTKEYERELTKIEQEFGLKLNPARYRAPLKAFLTKIFT